jgi:hypothetical protein
MPTPPRPPIQRATTELKATPTAHRWIKAKTTGDAILLTQQSIDALGSRPLGLVDRGAHAFKGKSATQVFGVDPASQLSM